MFLPSGLPCQVSPVSPHRPQAAVSSRLRAFPKMLVQPSHFQGGSRCWHMLGAVLGQQTTGTGQEMVPSEMKSNWATWMSFINTNKSSQIVSPGSDCKRMCIRTRISEQNVNYHVVAQSCPYCFATPWTVDCQLPLSIDFSRQEYWGGLPYPSPGESSPPRDWTSVSCIAGGIFTAESNKK